MKYWIDTEFIERPYTIDLISIGLVAEDGREFYAESSEVDWTKASQWTLQTVRPQLDGAGMEREEIGYAIRRFVDGDESPVFWGYFPAYDWVAFCWLFGSMDELPFHFPQLCLDIKQWAIELGDPDLPRQLGPRHHALYDARWTRDAWAFLASPLRSSNIGCCAVHPRACGERVRPPHAPGAGCGSSPRVRGTPVSDLILLGEGRFIPARAGNALRVSVCAKEGFTMSKSAPTFRIRSFWKRGGSSQGRHRRVTHQPKSIEIDWDAPVFPASLENEAGIVRRRPGDDGISFPDRALHLLPDHLARAPRIGANINTGPDLKKPDS
jgi:hypothetical protein